MADVIVGSYEWDAEKAARNLLKHKVSFEEARTAFRDTRAIVFDEGQGPGRFVLLGMSGEVRVLFVIHAIRVIGPRGGERTRLISARRATRPEILRYGSGDAPLRRRRR